MGLHLLLVSGSLRAVSANTAVLRTLARVAPDDVDGRLYDELASLPAFNPDADRPPLPPAVDRLRAAIHRADALVFSVPEYAGALPGSCKNLLDWCIGDDGAGSIYEKPVGWINASPARRRRYAELHTVLGYAHARIVDAACLQLAVTTDMIGPEGIVADGAVRLALGRLVETLAASV